MGKLPLQVPTYGALLALTLLLASCSSSIPSASRTGLLDSTEPAHSTGIPFPTEDLKPPPGPRRTPATDSTLSTSSPEFALYSAGYFGLWTIDASLHPSQFGPSMYVMGANDPIEQLSRPVPGLLSPSGRFLATYTASNKDQWCLTLKLVVLDTESGEIVLSIPLTPDSLATSVPFPNVQECYSLEEQFQYLWAIHPPQSMAWSPKGDRLAFVSAREGPSADIYVADVNDGTSARITTGPTQATAPIWSPDGAFVLNSSIVELRGMNELGGPFPVWGPVFATEVGTAASKPVYNPSQSRNLPQSFIAWTSPIEYLADSQDSPCGYTDLRSVNVISGINRIISTHSYENRAFAPEIDAVLISVPEEDPTSGYCRYSQEPGLYLVNLTTGQTDFISQESSDSAWWGSVEWLPSIHRFVVSSPHGVITVATDGTVVPVGPREASDLFVAPSGTALAITPIYSPRLLIFTPEGEQLASTNLGAYAVSWSSSGRSLAFFADDTLYIGRAPYFSPVAYNPGDWTLRPLSGDEVLWIEHP